jgi:putative transposase
VYTPSPRPYPARVPEPEYGSALQVRRVDRSGVIYWKGDVVFLSETLIGEPIGLLPQDDRFYTVYFMTSPIARFDSHRRRILALLTGAGAGEASPAPAPDQPVETRKKVSGMCPV